MSVRIPARRLAQPAVSLPLVPHRTFISDLFNSLRKRDKNAKPVQDPGKKVPKNPLLENYMKNKPSLPKAGQDSRRGDISSSSIFQEEARAAERDRSEAAVEDGRAAPSRDKQAMDMVLDPDPRARARWERKMVIRETRQRGRVSRTLQIKRTEREALVKSPMIKTSVKKLTKLAEQISGKPIEEAILQMRFSKKKAAKEVLKHLEYSRDHAIVSRGMGLGEAEDTKGEPTEIELKDGKRKLITDKTAIYVDQAWVGRGSFGRAYDYRARGRVYVMRLPMTSISVVLKEEATRIRQSEEKQKKRENRKVWVQLPDRPIQQQRQHLMW